MNVFLIEDYFFPYNNTSALILPKCTVCTLYSNRVRPFLFLIVSAIVVLFKAEVGPEHLWVINGRYIKSVQYPPPYSWLPATSRIANAISDCHIHLRLQTIAQIVLFIITSSSSNNMLCLPFMSLKRHCCLFIFFQCVLWHLDIWTSVFVTQKPIMDQTFTIVNIKGFLYQHWR